MTEEETLKELKLAAEEIRGLALVDATKNASRAKVTMILNGAMAIMRKHGLVKGNIGKIKAERRELTFEEQLRELEYMMRKFVDMFMKDEEESSKWPVDLYKERLILAELLLSGAMIAGGIPFFTMEEGAAYEENRKISATLNLAEIEKW